MKGLGKQVIPAHLHRHHQIHVIGGRGEKQNGDFGYLSNLPAPVVAVKKGQGDIQQYQLRVKGSELLQHIVEPLRTGRLIPPAFQMPLHGPRDDGVILHHKDSVHCALPLSDRVFTLVGA